jgi:hypothetical protein
MPRSRSHHLKAERPCLAAPRCPQGTGEEVWDRVGSLNESYIGVPTNAHNLAFFESRTAGHRHYARALGRELLKTRERARAAASPTMIVPWPVSGVTRKFGAIVLIAAGIYQWTPLKDICLTQCQSPFQFLMRYGGFRGAYWCGRFATGQNNRCRPMSPRTRVCHCKPLIRLSRRGPF